MSQSPACDRLTDSSQWENSMNRRLHLSRSGLLLSTLVAVLFALASGCSQQASAPTSAATATGVETTGEPGSPSATTTISGKQLPPPDPKFGGVIKEDALQSKTVVGAAHRAAQAGAQHPARS